MTCECEICKYRREFEQHISTVPEPAKQFFDDMYDLLFHAQFELDHAEAVISGDWPGADEYIAAIRACRTDKQKESDETSNTGV